MSPADDQFRLIVEQIPTITYTATLTEGTYPFLYISPQVESILGISPLDWISEKGSFVQHIHPDDRSRVLGERAQSALTHKPYNAEYRMIARDGRSVWFRDQAKVVKGPYKGSYLFQGVMVEITQSKRLEHELSRWDHETRSITENIPDIIARFDRQFRCLYLNRWFESSNPIPPESYLGRTNRSMGMPNIVVALWEENLSQVFQRNQPSLFEFSLPSSHGTRFYETRMVPEYSPDGNVEMVLAVTRDLTDRKQSELALQESEERFQQLADSIDDVFWLVDVNMKRIVYVSPAYERLWGASPLELYESPDSWLTVVHQEDRSEVKEWLRQKIAGGNGSKDYRIIRRDGTVRWIRDRAFPIKNVKGQTSRVAGIAQDFTERKLIEEEHLRTSKLDSLGLLAGGIAHDFNNLLTAILGQLALAKFSLSSDDRLYHRLTEAESASLRAQDLTQQLLTFARGGTPIKKAASLSQVVEENVKFVLTGSNIKCHMFFPDNFWTIEVDVGQISQVVQNLIINAKQAMPNGGEITIRGNNVVIGPERGQNLLGVPAGEWVRISFADQGVGISKENLVKIFDPYFTTKCTGTGLGLATSYSIIKNHGGLLTVDSELGVGTTFTMFLPTSEQVQISLDQRENKVQTGKGKILFMDDEAPIRGLLSEMLAVCGYTYESAQDGREAIDLYRSALEKGCPFHAVILDLTIPGGIGGKDVIRKLLEIDPQVKAVVVSGYSNDPVLANFKDYGFKERVVKPFRLAELSGVLHNVIAREIA